MNTINRTTTSIAAALLLANSAYAATLNAVPKYDHVVIVVMENESRQNIIGNAALPYINSLADQGVNFSNAHGVTHPSQPNYIAMFAGSPLGVTSNDCPVNFTGRPNLGSQLIGSGKTFKGYAESMPNNGYTGCLSGKYARKHNPWVNFDNVPAVSNLTFGAFPTDFSTLPTVSFVVPNMCNSMHDCSLATGDSWLKSNIDAYVRWAKTNNSLLILTWDEDNGSTNNLIPTIFVGDHISSGPSTQNFNHYSLLRTLEDMYAMPALGNAASANPISDVWSNRRSANWAAQDVGFSAATGAGVSSTLDVPDKTSNLRFVTTGGSGDADIYVKYGSAPTPTSYDCRSATSGNSESCVIPVAQAGTYHVLVKANAAYANVALRASFTTAASIDPPPVEPPTSGADRMFIDQALTAGQALVSSNGIYRLILQGDGNLVIYNAQNEALWASGTQGAGGTRLTLQDNGNLVLRNNNGDRVWSTQTAGAAAYRLVMHDSGNLILHEQDGTTIWSTHTAVDTGGTTPPPPPPTNSGTKFAQPVLLARMKDPALVEISGCAASRVHSNIFWVHNDSGDSARIFAVNTSGATVGTYNLSGATAHDYEDIAVGPGPIQGKTYIYVGDIGDNGYNRSNVQVYRTPEPGSLAATGTLAVEKFTFKYPNGSHNAETLMVDTNGDIYIASKAETPNYIYRFKAPFTNGGSYTGEMVTTMLTGDARLNGGDISVDGSRILMRTPPQVYLWLRKPGETIASALKRNYVNVPTAVEGQAEVVCWDKSGTDYYTLSEGSNRPFYYIKSLD